MRAASRTRRCTAARKATAVASVWPSCVPAHDLAERDPRNRGAAVDECGVEGSTSTRLPRRRPACIDTSHGHPLGGGHWWNEGYWKMLGAIRGGMHPTGC